MKTHRLASSIAAAAGALLVWVVAWIVPSPPAVRPDVAEETDTWEVLILLTKLEKECAPDSPSNDYTWTSNAPPTEKRRREILERFHTLREIAAPEVSARLKTSHGNEFGEMLIVLASALGDTSMIIPTAQLMAYSEHPAVRLCAARELRKLRDPRTIEWFDYAARNDDRRVRNDGCGRLVEYYYPIRTVAEIALSELGAPVKSMK